MSKYNYWELNGSISMETCTAFLNQIESLGVDTFLENYKKMILTLKQELEKQVEELTAEMVAMNSKEDRYNKIDHVLHKIKGFLQELGCIVLIFSIHINVGLDNHIYTETYNSIINQFFL